MQVDTSGWSGEGTFTHALLEVLEGLPGIAFLRVEDAPASRSDADYNFISNEIFVGFVPRARWPALRRLGLLRRGGDDEGQGPRTLADLQTALESADAIGAVDYADDGMLQFLRVERIIPPYQTRGYKLVEMVRIYLVGHGPDRRA
jgi:hypothetical protein